MQDKNTKPENMINKELKALKPDLEKMLDIIKTAKALSKAANENFAVKSAEIIGEAQKICENVKNRINSLIE